MFTVLRDFDAQWPMQKFVHLCSQSEETHGKTSSGADGPITADGGWLFKCSTARTVRRLNVLVSRGRKLQFTTRIIKPNKIESQTQIHADDRGVDYGSHYGSHPQVKQFPVEFRLRNNSYLQFG